MSGTDSKQAKSFRRLWSSSVSRKLAEAVDELKEAFFKKREMGVHSMLQRLEALNDKVLLSILRSESKDIEDDLPSRLDELGLLVTQGCHAHHNIFLYFFLARVKIIQHYCFKWLQEHFLVAEVLSLFFLQELVCQLPQ